MGLKPNSVCPCKSEVRTYLIPGRGGGSVTTEAEIGVTLAQVGEGWQPQEVGRGREPSLPKTTGKGRALTTP